MARKYRILLPLADGALTGLCCFLANTLLLSEFFPVTTESIYLLAAATAVVSSIPLWMILPRYTGIGQRILHVLGSVVGFLLFSVPELVNGLTINWRPIPLRVLSDADGLLVIVFFGLFFLFTAVVRLILIFARRNPS